MKEGRKNLTFFFLCMCEYIYMYMFVDSWQLHFCSQEYCPPPLRQCHSLTLSSPVSLVPNARIMCVPPYSEFLYDIWGGFNSNPHITWTSTLTERPPPNLKVCILTWSSLHLRIFKVITPRTKGIRGYNALWKLLLRLALT